MLERSTYSVKAVGGSDDSMLLMRAVGKATKEAICQKLEALDSNTVLELDFSHIQFMDVSCADEVTVKVLARLEAGEFPERHIVLSGLQEQHIENIQFALEAAEKAAISIAAGEWRVLGKLNAGYMEALKKVAESDGGITAKELMDVMVGYKAINEASSRLSVLYKKSLIGRVPQRESVRGGGRQFRYLSLLSS